MAVSLNTDSSGAVSTSDPFSSLLSGQGLTGLTNLLNSAFGGRGQSSSNVNTLASGTTDKTSPLALSYIQQLFPQLMQSAGMRDYSKQAAITDSLGGVNNIFRTLKEQTLPGVFSAEAASGGYNSTTRQQLSGDAAARAAAQAQSLITDTVTKYASADTARNKNLIDLINSAIVGQQQSNTSSMQNQATVGDTTNKGLLQNPLALGTAGALGLMSAIGGLGLPGGITAALAKVLGWNSATVNADGTVNWGTYAGLGGTPGAGGEGGFIGDITDPTQGFGDSLISGGEEIANPIDWIPQG